MRLDDAGALEELAVSSSEAAHATLDTLKALMAKMEHEKEIICNGLLPYDDYKNLTGRIRGLQMALDAIEEVNAEIKKAEQGSK